MKRIVLRLAVVAVIAAAPAGAMNRDYGRAGAGARAPIADPDERLERMAAASTPSDASRGKPRKSVRGILKDDPYLRDSFAWLDNK